MSKNQNYKIAIYIRVSTEEQAQNPEGSIKNQEERCRTTVRLKNEFSNFGEIVKVYIDRGLSGKNTKRPELQNLLMAIRKGEVNLVMVTELSRLSRSIKDFAEMWDMMKNFGCDFLSLREAFDTTTAAGEMVIFNIASMAQFERRQVSERVSANFQARAERGLYNGGSIPFGFKRIPDKVGYLDIEEEHAEVVRTCFKTFLREETLMKSAKWLNDNNVRVCRKREGGGQKVRLGHFTFDNLHDILRNKAYAGIKTYKAKGIDCETKAVWPAIVDDITFTKVQDLLTKNHSQKKAHSDRRYPYLLTGLLSCKVCGDTMAGKSAWGKAGKIGYYEHGWMLKRQSCLSKKVFNCAPNRVLAKKIEPVVWREVQKLLTDKNFQQELILEAKQYFLDNSNHKEIERIKAKICGLGSQLEAMAERLSELPKGVSAVYIYKQMEKMEVLKIQTEAQLIDVQIKGNDQIPVELSTFQNYTDAIRDAAKIEDPDVKTKLIRRLLKQVQVTPEGIEIHFNMDQRFYEQELVIRDTGKKEIKAGTHEGAGLKNLTIDLCSNSLTNGGGGGNRTRVQKI